MKFMKNIYWIYTFNNLNEHQGDKIYNGVLGLLSILAVSLVYWYNWSLYPQTQPKAQSHKVNINSFIGRING